MKWKKFIFFFFFFEIFILIFLLCPCRKARRKEKADVAGVTGGSNAGLGGGGGGLGLSGTVSLSGAGVGNGPSTLVGGLVSHTGAHGQYGDAEHKLYLESTVLERKVPEADLRQLIDLPPGLDLNEWLASHSKYKKILLFLVFGFLGHWKSFQMANAFYVKNIFQI